MSTDDVWMSMSWTAWTACHTLALDDAPSRVCSSCAPSRVCSNCCEEIISGGEGDGGGGRRHACKQLACVQVVEARARAWARRSRRRARHRARDVVGGRVGARVGRRALRVTGRSSDVVDERRATACPCGAATASTCTMAACERAADRDGAVAGGTRVPLLGATFGEAATLRFRFEVSGDRRRSLCLWAARSSCAAPPSRDARRDVRIGVQRRRRRR